MFESQRKLLYESPHGLVYSRKLDTALRDTTVKSFKNRYVSGTDMTFNDKQFINIMKHKSLEHSIMTSTMNYHSWPAICRDILQGKIQPTSAQALMARRLASIMTTALEVQLNYVNSNFHHSDTPILNGAVQTWLKRLESIPPVLFSLLYAESFFAKVVESLPTIQVFSNESEQERLEKVHPTAYHQDKELKINIVIGKDISYINHMGKPTLVPTAYILLIHNKIADLISVLVLAYMSSGSGLESDAYTRTILFLQDLCIFISKHQNIAYNLMKCIESLGIGITLREVDGLTNSRFLNNICNSINETFQVDITTHQFFNIMVDATQPFRHELMCLSKILGHPFVDMKEGTLTLFSRVQDDLPIDPLAVKHSVYHAKKSYIKNYLMKRGKWPDCEVTSATLRKFQISKSDPDDAAAISKYGQWTVEDFELVTLKKERRFIMLEQIIPHLKDKTISIMRSEVIRHYLTEQKPKERVRWEDTRLLLYYLLKENCDENHRAFLNSWCYDADIDLNEYLDYLVVRIVPKEKELKISYRGFGCRPEEMRMATLAQEKTAAHFLEEFCPEQAMTLDELGVLRKLLSFRRIEKAYSNYKPIYCVIDATAWNSYHRQDAQAPVLAETLDNIHGSYAFQRTHIAYENTLYYVPDQSGNWHWQGQLGGIEGQHQYTWDWTYLAQVKTALEPIGYPHLCFVKGDDLRVVVMVPPIVLQNESISDVQKRIVETIKRGMSNFGHRIKTDDSYGSTAYFAFSKSASIGLVELPQTFRKIQKCHGANNSFLPFLDDYIASSFSNAHSACKVGVSTIGPYSVALFWSLYHLLTHPRYKEQGDQRLAALMFVPSLLGGFPTILLHNMWIRAESDLLSPFIDLCHFTRTRYPEIHQHLMKFLMIKALSPEKAFIGLLADPYSLPIMKPVQATNILYKMIKPALKRLTRNTLIRELYQASESQAMKSFIKCLYSTNVFDAKILSALYAASPEGLLNELLRKFETGRSILEVLILRYRRSAALNKLKDVISADNRVHTHRIKVLEGRAKYTEDLRPLLNENQCPEKIARTIREKLWGKPVDGISMPPVRHQIKIIDDNTRTGSEHEINNKFTYTIHPATSSLAGDALPAYRSADKKPFIGYKTRNGLEIPSVQLIEKDPVLNKVQSLLDLLSWTNIAEMDAHGNEIVSNMNEVILHLMTIYITLDTNKLEPFKGERRGGTIQHHVRSPGFRESIVPNTLSNIYTMFDGSSNTHLRLVNSREHYRVNFLHIFCHVAMQISMAQQLDNNLPLRPQQFYAITTDCEHCSEPLRERALVCNTRLLGDKYELRNQLSKISEHGQKIIEQTLSNTNRKLQQNILPAEDLEPKYAKMGIIQYFVTSKYSNKERMIRHTYQHAMSEEAYSIMSDMTGSSNPTDKISKTELKKIEDKYIVEGLMLLVLKYAHTEFPTYNVDDFSIHIRQVPSSTLPWVSLLSELLGINRLYSFLLYLQQKTGISFHNISHNAHSAAYYVGDCIHLMFLLGMYDELCYTHLTSYTMIEAQYVIIEYAYLIKYKHVISVYSDHLKNVCRLSYSQLNRQILRDTMARIAVCLDVPAMELSEFEEILKDIALNSSYVYKLSDYDSYDLEDHDDASPTTKRALHQMLKSCPDTALRQDAIRFIDNMYMAEYHTHMSQALDYLINHPEETPSLTIIYTRFTTCTHVVRSQHNIQFRVDPVAHANAVGNDIEFGLPYNHYGYSPSIIPVSVYRATGEDIVGVPEIIVPESCNEYVIRPYYFFRTHGFGTSAPSKLLEILNALQIKLSSDSTYAFLGDGEGGFLASVAELTKNCNLIFNTLVCEVGIFPAPLVDRDTVENNRHSIFDGGIRRGLSDLTLAETLFDIEKEANSNLVSMVTCDAQTLDMNMVLRDRLVSNVVVYYLRRRTVNGVLILKMYSNEIHILLKTMKFLTDYCIRVFLTKPPASGLNSEWYLVAQGQRRIYKGTYDKIPDIFFSYANNTHLVNQINMALSKKLPFNEATVSAPISDWVCGWPIDEYRTLFVRGYAVAMVNQRIGLNFEDFMRGLTGSQNEMILQYQRFAQAQIRPAMTLVLNRIRNYPTQSTTEWGDNTFAHKRALINNYMVMSGYAATLSQAVTSSSYISDLNLRDMYNRLLNYLNQSFFDECRNVFTVVNTVRAVEWQPYESFLHGYHIGLSFYGYFEKRSRHRQM